ETTWDLSCTNSLFLGAFGFGSNAENNCNDPQVINAGLLILVGGSGGVSKCTVNNSQSPSSCSGGYAKPSWQVAPGVPADGKRDLPDVSLFASNGVLNSFYIFCEADSFANCSFGEYGAAGGTSFGAPAFAGIMALVNQQMQNLHLPARQGNANYGLYKLAAQQNAASCNSSTGPASTCVFNDITNGTIAVPCVAGSKDCVVKTSGHQYGILSGYSTGTGFDLATGLGSINVNNLVSKWSSVIFRSTVTSLALSPTSNITHGQNVTVTASVAPGSGSTTPTPSGAISLLTSTGASAGNFTLNAGSVSSATNLLPGGNYTVTAHYAGDSTYGGSDSAPVNITIGKENSSPQLELVTFGWQGNLISANASTAVYGSPYLLHVDVFNSAGGACQTNNVQQSGCPTGNVALTDNGSTLDAGSYPLNSFGYTEDQVVQFPGGNNSVKAQYAGDSSFNASSATKPYNITPAPTTISASPTTCCLYVGGPYQSGAVIQSQSLGVTPTGTFTFLVNGSPSVGNGALYWIPPSGFPPIVTYGTNFFSSNSPFPNPGNYTLSATYSGDANYQPATSTSVTVRVKYPTPTINLRASPNPVNSGSTTNLVATVLGSSTTIAPTGTISLASANTGNLSGSISYATITDPNTGNLDLQGTITITPQFTDGYFANYSGDNNYQSAGSPAATIITVNGTDFGFTAQPSSYTVSPGGSAFYSLFVGFQSGTAPVAFGSTACSGLPKETTCSVSPDPVSSITTINLVIATT
ncbi:MAG: hypothetical protein DMG97_06855, partial [Acidobacteria bacterium]